MMIQEITSADHKLVKKIASLKEKKYRERYGAFLVEGALSVEWALTSSFRVIDVVQSADYALPPSLGTMLSDKTVTLVPPHVFTKMADTKTPQGILCTCALPHIPDAPESGLFVYCDGVRDPGNLGTIIRTADAMGFDGVILSPDCVDPFNPKLVRSTMGSLFHVGLFVNVSHEMLLGWQANGFSLTASALTAQSISSCDWSASEKTVLVMGNEAGGVSETLLAQANAVVKIPMAGSAESLNVAAAAAILMYEAAQAVKRI